MPRRWLANSNSVKTINKTTSGLICIAVLATVLTLGLWPFHAPANDVTWLRDRAGLRFGGTSTAISSGVLQTHNPGEESGGSLEFWLRPISIWDSSSTFLEFSSPENPFQLLVRQSQTGLEIQAGQGSRRHTRIAKLYVHDVFRKPRPVFVTITSGPNGTSVYVDGVLVKTASWFRLATRHFTGRLVVGDSLGQSDSWRGQLFGLAVYHTELSPTQAVRHYVAWTHERRPGTVENERNVALYLFDEHAGNVAHNTAGRDLDLQIPGKYMVLDKNFLEPFWQEFSLSWSYWSAVLKNIVGFIPLGFCFYTYLTALRVERAGLATVILGTAVSVTIEVLQAYLPTRDSGTTDIFTNTLGTWIGVASCKVVGPILARAFPRVPFLTPPCPLECATRAHRERD